MSQGVLAQSGFVERSRFRTYFSGSSYSSDKHKPSRPRLVNDINLPDASSQIGTRTKKHSLETVRSRSAKLVLSRSLSLHAEAPKEVSKPVSAVQENTKRAKRFLKKTASNLRPHNRLQTITLSLSLMILLVGVYASFVAYQNNNVVHAQAIKLTNEANKASANTSPTSSTSNGVLSTVKPTPKVIAAYAVAPNYPKILKIPSIGVDSIVGQTGMLASGALGTPSNVYYTDWYTGSAEPGQPGATLIDGHVSSWTSKGIFFNLHLLKAGDAIQIVKGDNSVVNYQVVQTTVYSSGNVDMQAAVTPIVPGVSGLNLITCTGQVIKGTSEFNQRIIVFAKEV